MSKHQEIFVLSGRVKQLGRELVHAVFPNHLGVSDWNSLPSYQRS